MADIVIINPRFDTSYWGLEHAMPFLGIKAVLPVASLPLLAALTPPEHTVTLIDENVEPIDFALCARADIVGVTGMNVQRARMHEILAELRRRGCFTAVGGPWVTVREEDIAGRADVIFIGEAEESWPRFLAEWAEGRHAARYEQAGRTDMETVPQPRLDLLRMKDYALGSVQFSRGCPFECEFCDIIVTFGRRPRIKSAAQVLAELDGLRRAGKRTAFIVDDNLIGNKRAIKPLLREVIAWQQSNGFPLMFATEASIDLAEDAELMQLMVEANITEVFIGIETPNEAALRETKKVQNLAAGAARSSTRCIGSRMPEWRSGAALSSASTMTMQAFLRPSGGLSPESRIAHAMVNMLVAIPRTPLYKRLEREGRLDNSGDPAGFGPFGTNVIPSRIGRAELYQGYVELMRDLYTPEAFFGRLDALYLDGGMTWGKARARHLRRRPLRRLRLGAQLLTEALAILIMLTRGVPDPALRREYRRRLLRVALRRPAPAILQLYAIKCAMHFHVHTMVQQMQPTPAGVDRAAA